MPDVGASVLATVDMASCHPGPWRRFGRPWPPVSEQRV